MNCLSSIRINKVNCIQQRKHDITLDEIFYYAEIFIIHILTQRNLTKMYNNKYLYTHPGNFGYFETIFPFKKKYEQPQQTVLYITAFL